MANDDAPKVRPIWIPGTRLAGFIKRTTIHCYKQNMEVFCLVVSKENFLCVFRFKKVQVGNDHEKAQSEKDSHSKNRGGKN